jgi:cytochrome oxidase assembly protein ShyY1
MKIKHFTLYGRRYYLKLELAQSLIFTSIFILCSLLAAWQWQRAEASHQQLLQANVQQLKVDNQITLAGQWSQQNILLDHRTHKGKVGYYHLGLFKPEGSQHHLLINLGWLQAPILRSDIPSPAIPTGSQSITLTNLPIIKPVVWTSDHWPSPIDKAWPKRIQSIDIERFELATKYKVDSGYWQLVAGKGKLIDIYKSSPYLNKHKHLGYAMQWLLIAIAALMVGIFSAIRLEEKDELLD